LLAAQALYQLDVRPGDPGEAFDEVADMHEAPEEVRGFGRALVAGTRERLEEIDRLLAEHLSETWTLGRLGKVERAIMRLATLELIRDQEVPTPVILDEALELTRDFADEAAVRFVNGVMDRVARTVRGVAGDAPEGSRDEPETP
jgi:N utilization substance protein B